MKKYLLFIPVLAAMAFTACDPKTEEKQPEPWGCAVDLGLSVKWASFNVGATKPEEYGHYIAWGETAPKDFYDWQYYKFAGITDYAVTKYKVGAANDKTVLEAEDDAAHVNCGGEWRMPTKQEFDELIEKCTWELTVLNGVYGCKFTSKVEGFTDNSIFLPAAGYMRATTGLKNDGDEGRYWSSTLCAYETTSAYTVSFEEEEDGVETGNHVRNYGYSVRPVCP